MKQLLKIFSVPAKLVIQRTDGIIDFNSINSDVWVLFKLLKKKNGK